MPAAGGCGWVWANGGSMAAGTGAVGGTSGSIVETGGYNGRVTEPAKFGNRREDLLRENLGEDRFASR